MTSTRNTHKTRSRRSRTAPKFPAPERIGTAVCLDCETTQHGELLELSVFDAMTDTETYHSLFRPRAHRWPTNIHHITPQMVAHAPKVGSCREGLVAAFGETRFVIGCAVSGDMAILRRHGITFPKETELVDIQKWYWLLHDDSNRTNRNQTGLAEIAAHYGLDFGPEHQHSATADARLTLSCFRCLRADFLRSLPAEAAREAEAGMAELMRRFNDAYRHAIEQYRLHTADGYVSLVSRAGGYSLKFNSSMPGPNPQIEHTIHVADRRQAENELRARFKKYELRGYTGIYRLDAAARAYFRKYTNHINPALHTASDA